MHEGTTTKVRLRVDGHVCSMHVLRRLDTRRIVASTMECQANVFNPHMEPQQYST